MRHLQVFLEKPEQVHVQEQVLRLKLELCFSVRQYRGPTHVDVSWPERPRGLVDMNVEMIGAHRPLEQSGPQEQRAKYRIDEECRDDDNCPTSVPKPLWPVQFGPLWRSAAIYWPLDLRRAL